MTLLRIWSPHCSSLGEWSQEDLVCPFVMWGMIPELYLSPIVCGDVPWTIDVSPYGVRDDLSTITVVPHTMGMFPEVLVCPLMVRDDLRTTYNCCPPYHGGYSQKLFDVFLACLGWSQASLVCSISIGDVPSLCGMIPYVDALQTQYFQFERTKHRLNLIGMSKRLSDVGHA